MSDEAKVADWTLKFIPYVAARLAGSEAEKAQTMNAIMTALSISESEALRHGARMILDTVAMSGNPEAQRVGVILANGLSKLAGMNAEAAREQSAEWERQSARMGL